MQSTPQQIATIQTAQSGTSFCVEAGAGSGKTTTNRLIAEHLPNRRILYTSFGRSVISDAQGKFPPHVAIKGIHQLAFARIGHTLRDKLNKASSEWAFRVAMKDRFEKAYRHMNGEPERINAVYDAVLHTFFRFLNSDDRHPSSEYLPGAKRMQREEVEMHLKLAWRLWLACTDPNDPAPATHDVYLKAFALSNPVLPYDTIMVDEAQDCSPVMLGLIERQPAQKIYVGDPNQAIYSFRDAVSAFDHVRHSRLPLTGCWRFGPEVAAVANTCLAFERGTFRLQGLGPQTRVNVGSAAGANGVVARSNGTLISEAIAASYAGKTIGFYGGIDEALDLLIEMEKFSRTNFTNHRALRVFKNWDELTSVCETRYASELRPYVRLVDDYEERIPSICATLRAAHRDIQIADVRFGTTHKFKGAEVDHLYVAGDFAPIIDQDSPKDPPAYDAEAMHLAYVAVTRGRRSVTLAHDFVGMLRESAEIGLAARLLDSNPLDNLPPAIQPYSHQVGAFTMA